MLGRGRGRRRRSGSLFARGEERKGAAPRARVEGLEVRAIGRGVGLWGDMARQTLSPKP